MSNKHRPDLFVYTVNAMDYGVLPQELSNELAELIQGVKDTNKQGTLTLKLTVKPESIAAGQVSITPDITNKVPQLPRDKALMFMTPDNNLEREDPRQKKLDFTAVDGGKKDQAFNSTEQTSEKNFAQAQ